MYYSEDSGLTYKEVSIKALDSMPIGSIILFAGQVIPTGWKVCDGSVLRVGITQSGATGEYADLYKVIGTTYGTEEPLIPLVGAVDFKIPDLRGKVPVGQDGNDTNFDTIGGTGGSPTNYIGEQNLPWSIPIRKNASGDGFSQMEYGLTGWQWYANNNFINAQPVNNLQPYLVVNYIIKVKNTTPTMASVVNATNSSTEDSYSCDYINEALEDVYSTTEIKTNKVWIDGKPIYRKVLLASKNDFSASNHLYAIPTGVSNLKDYTHIEARLKRTGDLWNEIPNGFGMTSANGWATTINDILKNSISIQIGDNVYNYLETNDSVMVIIEYTKTTD